MDRNDVERTIAMKDIPTRWLLAEMFDRWYEEKENILRGLSHAEVVERFEKFKKEVFEQINREKNQ